MTSIPVPFTSLPYANVPLSGFEVFACVQDGASKQVPGSAIGQNGASFLLLTGNSNLPNGRILTPGAGINIADGGPGEALTISASSSAGGPTFWTLPQSAVLGLGNNNNFALNADNVIVRLTPDAGSSAVTGMDATGNSGRMVVLLNIGAADVTIPHQSASSIAANRFTNIGGFDLVIPPGGSSRFWYDSASSTWRGV